jgi:hypothetical protein
MSANEDLIAWNTRWRLSNGIVSCKTCGAEQSENDREVMFEHQAGCGYAGQGARPWDDLYRITTEFKAGH